jgi:hypothetical protein
MSWKEIGKKLLRPNRGTAREIASRDRGKQHQQLRVRCSVVAVVVTAAGNMVGI